MKKLLSLFLITGALQAFAGDDDKFSPFGLYIGYNTSSTKHATFEQFRTSYNEYQKALNNIDHELQPWGIGVGGVTIGGAARSRFFSAHINYASIKNSTYASFPNGEERHFKLKESVVCTGFGAGFAGEKIYAHVVGGIGFGDSMIKCYYQYNDGTKSYGQETQISGSYHSISIAPYYGINMGFAPAKRDYRVFLAAVHYGSGFDNNRTVMDDIASSKSLAPVEYPSGLPLDYGAYQTSTSNYDYGTNNYVKGDLKSWTFTIGFEYALFTNE